MRPHELILDGFRSYAAATTLDWDDRSLVGIVGPIGSGKSSILDGIAFALYGRTPRLGAETKGLINQRRDEGKVSLVFSVDGERWKVVRALRRRGQSAHALYRVGEDGDVEVSDKAREVTERITELLGLDYDGFRRSILLAQGQFAQFLEATAGDRNAVLKGVFGFERLDAMRDAARRRRDEAAAGLTALERLRQQADRDRKDLDKATLEREDVTARLGRLETAAGPAEEAQQAIAAADAVSAAIDEERKALTALAGRIPDRDETEELLPAAGGATAAVEAAKAAVDSAAEAETAAKTTLEEVVSATGGREALTEARALLGLVEERSASAGRAADAAERAAKASAESAEASASAAAEAADAEQAAAAAVDVVEAAEVKAADAEEARHRAQHLDMAGSLRRSLEPGEPCPVCEQPVAEVPAAGDTKLESAEAGRARAADALDAARKAEADASQAAAAAQAAAKVAAAEATAKKQAAADALDEAQAAETAAGATHDELAALLGGADDPTAELGDRTGRLGAAEVAVEDSRGAAAAAAEEYRSAVVASGEISSRLDSLRARVAELAGRLEAPDLEGLLAGDAGQIADALRGLRDLWVDRNDGLDRRMGEAEEARAAGKEALGQAVASAGLEDGADLGRELAGAREALAAAEARVEDLTKRLEDLVRLEEEHAGLIDRHTRYGSLYDDLAPSKFPAFVLDDRRRALAALGSERFEYLSSGRYRFTDDGEFDVVDLSAADLTRSAASLSGGETFLASLALALALAEIVSREGGRLDAFFLDEGFGSLDEEHVGLAMDGIERLVLEGPDRLIVVVSHVAGLQARLEDLIVLSKDEVTGDTSVRSGAAAPA